jgi:hypothetical protein
LAAVTQLVLPFLVVFAWLPGISAPYQYDDYNTPVGDPASQSLSAFWQAMPQTLRPLTKLSYALESSLGAMDAPSRRFFNALVFSACVALVRELVRKVGASPLVALAVAVLWGLHPVHAETIVALAGRPVLVCLCLTLASAVLLLSQQPWWAIACAALAVTARESGLPWLVVCAALSAQQLGLSRRKLFLTAGAAAVVGLGALLSVRTLQHLVTSSLSAPGAINRLGLQWAALFRGTLDLFAAPASFTLDMDFAPTGTARFAMILGAVALYASALWIAFGRRSPRDVANEEHARDYAVRIAALLWLCLVIPTHSVIPKVDPFTARPFSASLAPLLVLSTYGVTTLYQHLTGPSAATRTRRPLRLAISSAACLTLLVFVHITQTRATLYQDPVALWRDAAERSEHKTRPLVNLGTLLAKRGELHDAEAALGAALKRDPSSLEIHSRLGAIRRLRALGDPSLRQ